MKKANPFNLAYEQYQMLQKEFSLTEDAHEKHMLMKRLTNLLTVMAFLISLHNMH